MEDHVTGLVTPSMTVRPHLDQLPPSSIRHDHISYRGTAVADYLTVSRRWELQRVGLSTRLSVAVWLVFLTTLGVVGWLISVARAPTTCTGRLCRLATLGGHPTLTLVLAGISVGLFFAMALVTRGLTRAGSVELTLILVAAATGFVACMGAVLVVLLIALAILLAATAIFLVLITIGNRS
jgi:hypothetical protein